MDEDQIATTQKAVALDWSSIDRSILGTLFERGLDPGKRAQLGAHYTDRDKTMRIVDSVGSRWMAIGSRCVVIQGRLAGFKLRAEERLGGGPVAVARVDCPPCPSPQPFGTDSCRPRQTGDSLMGLAGWFSTFCGNIQVKNGATISGRYRNITKRLNTDFWSTTSDTAHSLYVGSYGRRTAIHGTSDVDMIFWLPDSVYDQYNGYLGNGQSALLQAVRVSVKKTYPATEVGADGQVVVVSFGDDIRFDLVPAFTKADGSFTYPDSNQGGSWRQTNPRPEIEAIRDRNDSCNGNLIRLCRMMRAWKAKMTVPIGGLLIDTLAYQFIGSWEYRNKSFLFYDYMCRDFFEFMASQDKPQEYWKAPGSGQWVYGPKGQFQYKARRGYNLACEAIKHETADPKREWSAKQKWRDIFGTSFPS